MIYTLSKDGFIKKNDSDSAFYRTITTELIKDECALHKQDNSLNEYQNTHVQESLTPQIQYLMQSFRFFINYHLPPPIKIENASIMDAQPTVLDVGCGISKRIPLYFREIADKDRAIYVGLDPFEVNAERDYFFINGVFEGLHAFVQHKFDCVIFSTSLDHFNDLSAVSQEIKNLVKENGIAIFWVGVHDPNIVAVQSISESLRGFSILSVTRMLTKAIKFPLSLVKLYFAMKRRSNKLQNHIPLDELHFHYFTESSLKAFIETVGVIVECQHVKNTNSFFYAVRINS